MRNLVVLNSCKKDFKRIKKRGWDRIKFERIVSKLRKAEPLPTHTQPHKLTGEWQDFWECHIAPDWLLVYAYDDETVTLVRTGSHADLFE